MIGNARYRCSCISWATDALDTSYIILIVAGAVGVILLVVIIFSVRHFIQQNKPTTPERPEHKPEAESYGRKADRDPMERYPDMEDRYYSRQLPTAYMRDRPLYNRRLPDNYMRRTPRLTHSMIDTYRSRYYM